MPGRGWKRAYPDPRTERPTPPAAEEKPSAEGKSKEVEKPKASRPASQPQKSADK